MIKEEIYDTVWLALDRYTYPELRVVTARDLDGRVLDNVSALTYHTVGLCVRRVFAILDEALGKHEY